jgi:hypothetical protein
MTADADIRHREAEPAVFAPIGDRCEFTKRVYCTVRLVVLSSRSPTMR